MPVIKAEAQGRVLLQGRARLSFQSGTASRAGVLGGEVYRLYLVAVVVSTCGMLSLICYVLVTSHYSILVSAGADIGLAIWDT